MVKRYTCRCVKINERSVYSEMTRVVEHYVISGSGECTYIHVCVEVE